LAAGNPQIMVCHILLNVMLANLKAKIKLPFNHQE
jgi:hypothetical protein